MIESHRWHGACLLETARPDPPKFKNGRRRGANGSYGDTEETVVMNRAFRAFVVLVMMLTVAAGCQTMTGKTAGENVDDAQITASVKSKLVADKAANLTRVDVDTNRGTVYLNGSVETPEQKAQAERLAWQAKGVKGVVNNLQVQKTR
jgi:hyperosmotically inducible periplasmic protein